MKRHVNCGALSFISLISNSIEQVANAFCFVVQYFTFLLIVMYLVAKRLVMYQKLLITMKERIKIVDCSVSQIE